MKKRINFGFAAAGLFLLLLILGMGWRYNIPAATIKPPFGRGQLRYH